VVLQQQRVEENRNPLVPEFDELTRWSAAAFLEDTWSLTDRFNLTLGARYDHDELYQGNISPRIYGVYNFTDQFTVKGGVSTVYLQSMFLNQFPSFPRTYFHDLGF